MHTLRHDQERSGRPAREHAPLTTARSGDISARSERRSQGHIGPPIRSCAESAVSREISARRMRAPARLTAVGCKCDSGPMGALNRALVGALALMLTGGLAGTAGAVTTVGPSTATLAPGTLNVCTAGIECTYIWRSGSDDIFLIAPVDGVIVRWR